jgi:hypothetical protein
MGLAAANDFRSVRGTASADANESIVWATRATTSTARRRRR